MGEAWIKVFGSLNGFEKSTILNSTHEDCSFLHCIVSSWILVAVYSEKFSRHMV